MKIYLNDYSQCQLDNWYWFKEVFTTSELEEINKIQETIPFTKAQISATTNNLEIKRKSSVKWLRKDDENFTWLYEKFIQLVTKANNELWRFDLTEVMDDIQYTVYNDDGGHFNWHLDLGSGDYARRKVSLTMQLSDPDEYEGGDFEFMIGNEVQKLPKQKGCVIIFPSYFLHRVTPVTRGTRRSLVLWISGQPFK